MAGGCKGWPQPIREGVSCVPPMVVIAESPTIVALLQANRPPARLIAADMIGARCASVNASEVTTRPPPGSRPRAVMAVPISASL